MPAHPTPIDISSMPDLVRLTKEVEATQTPLELKREDKIVAVLTPVTAATNKKTAYTASLAALGSWRDLNADELIANIHRWRQEGSRPATRP